MLFFFVVNRPKAIQIWHQQFFLTFLRLPLIHRVSFWFYAVLTSCFGRQKVPPSEVVAYLFGKRKEPIFTLLSSHVAPIKKIFTPPYNRDRFGLIALVKYALARVYLVSLQPAWEHLDPHYDAHGDILLRMKFIVKPKKPSAPHGEAQMRFVFLVEMKTRRSLTASMQLSFHPP